MPVDADLHIPHYGRGSLADLVPSLLSALAVPGFDNALCLEAADAICLLVVDGLGWELLRDHAADAPFLAELAGTARPLTTGFPSTTAASLASIGTGHTPGEHGFVGYTMVIPGQDRLLNSLTWQQYWAGPAMDLREQIVPEQFQSQPTAFERATADGVAITLTGPGALAASGFTRAALRGGRYQGVAALGDLVIETAGALAAAPRVFVYAYCAELDAVGHLRGVASDAWRLQLTLIDRAVAALAERISRNAMFAIVGDHGMVDLRPEELIDLDQTPALAEGVRFLAGEARARHIHVLPGAEADVLAAWRSLLGDRMWVLPRDEAINLGLFGPRVSAGVTARIGDLVGLARGAVGVVQRSIDAKQAALVGHHGSVTPAEQLVPLLLLRG